MPTRSPEARAGQRARWQMRVVVLGAVLGVCALAWQARGVYRARAKRMSSAVERWEDEGGALARRPR